MAARRRPHLAAAIVPRPGMLFLILPAFLFFTSMLPASADENPSAEYKLKAALIYKLGRFVDWPDSGLRDTVGICVIGRDSFGAAIDVLEARTLRKQAIRVRRIAIGAPTFSECAILFIADDRELDVPAVLEKLNNQATLTIGDSEDFSSKGGMIQMSFERKKIRFTINLQQTVNAGLKIAAPLLELSTVIRTNDTGGGQ